MRCRFLRETNVEYCGAVKFRKMIAQSAVAPDERCALPDYVRCPVFVQSATSESRQEAKCPHLTECTMQYCEAAPTQRYVPYSEPGLTRCGTSAHAYCDLYLAMANPGEARQTGEITAPQNLRYTPNHMWFDAAEDGTWHAGIDALLARVLGRVDSIAFLTTDGVNHPVAVATVGGMDLQLMFPSRMRITGSNVRLRSHPERLTASPYTFGWLFEGIDAGQARNVRIRGSEAARWMEQELDLMSRFVHEQFRPPGMSADGGVFQPGLLEHLSREQALRLFNQFFMPFTRL